MDESYYKQNNPQFQTIKQTLNFACLYFTDDMVKEEGGFTKLFKTMSLLHPHVSALVMGEKQGRHEDQRLSDGKVNIIDNFLSCTNVC